METWLIIAGIIVLLLCLITTLVALLVFSGAFEGVEIKAGSPPLGKVVIAYKFARGPYNGVGYLFTEIASISPNSKCIGIYYDNPLKVEAHRQRYAVSCVLAEDDQLVDENLKKMFESEGYKIMELPRVDYAVHTIFPFKTTFSIFIAASKVYPKLKEFIWEHKLCAHPFIEIYINNTIHFMAPLSKQKEFYVPESLERFPDEEPYEEAYSESEESFLDVSQSETSLDDTESQTEPSLLDSPEVVRAAYLGEKVPDQDQITTDEETAADSTREVTKEERASDEDSASSFEEVKMTEADEKDIDIAQ